MHVTIDWKVHVFQSRTCNFNVEFKIIIHFVFVLLYIQVHLLTLVAHGIFRNGICNEPMFQVEYMLQPHLVHALRLSFKKILIKTCMV